MSDLNGYADQHHDVILQLTEDTFRAMETQPDTFSRDDWSRIEQVANGASSAPSSLLSKLSGILTGWQTVGELRRRCASLLELREYLTD